MNKVNKTQNKNSYGFTLVELLLVITLIAISVGVTSDVLMSLIKSYNKTTVINDIEQQANFVGLKLEKELRNASNVSVPNSNQLSFDYLGTAVYYNVSGGNLFRSTSGYSTAAADALIATPSINGTVGGVNLACDTACFTLTGSSPQVVGLSLIFSQASAGGVSFSGVINVKNTIVIRNTY